MGVLLKVRALLWAVIGLSILGASSAPVAALALGALIIAAGAIAPFVIRRSGRFSGVRLSAAIDLGAAYLVWVFVPLAAVLTIIVAIWTVAVVVFLSPPSTARRFALAAVGLELSKLIFVFAAPDILGRDTAGLGWLILGRATAISATYFVLHVVDEYLSRLYAASESGSDRYRRLMDAAPTAFLVAADEEIVYANPAAAELLGDASEDLIGQHLTTFVAAGRESELRALIRRAEERLETFELDGVAMRTAAGETRHVDATVNAVDFANGLAVQIALSDVSAQVAAESKLRETRLNYQSFFERIPVALYRSRPDGEIIQANRALVELLGARSEVEIIGVNAHAFYVDPTDREHLTTLLTEQQIVIGYEAKMRRMDGSEVWVRDTSRLIKADIGDVYEGAMVDVSGRRSMEDELWSRAMQQEAAASIGQMALETDDVSGIMRSVAETVSRVLRTDGAAILERDPTGAFALIGTNSNLDVDADAVAAVADRAHMTAAPVVLRTRSELEFAAPSLAASGYSSALAVMIPGADIEFGTLAVVSKDERIFTSDDLNFLHAVANVLAAGVDRAAAQARLEDLLRSKDAFVASVSHELRTPLTVVTGMAHELNERWMDLSDEEFGEFTQLLVEQSRDMSDLIEDLLVAARANIGNVAVRNEPLELDDQVRSVLAGFPSVSPAKIDASLVAAVVDADPIRVRQIIRNLLTNALRYGGPNIEVAMASTPGAVTVEVRDDGPGIPLADRERIFAAYERAHHKAGQPGSVGLGLTVSRTLAELMGGSLTYDYTDRSVFRLELPRDADDERIAMDDRDWAEALGVVGRGRIGVDVGVVD